MSTQNYWGWLKASKVDALGLHLEAILRMYKSFLFFVTQKRVSLGLLRFSKTYLDNKLISCMCGTFEKHEKTIRWTKLYVWISGYILLIAPIDYLQ